MKNTIFSIAIIFLGAGLAFAVTAAAQPAAANARIFKAGAATSNVTPPIGGAIVGGFFPPTSTHIRDELHARCLVLDDGLTRLAFVVVDNFGVDREVFDEAGRLIHEATGLPRSHVMMSATHAHTATSARGTKPVVMPWSMSVLKDSVTGAPVFGGQLDDYQRFLARRIADGVRRAINNLEPARIGWGAGQVPQYVFNRRWLLKNGKTVINPLGGEDRALMNPGNRPDLLEPAGPVNPEVYFLSIQSANGRPIALLANYWMHYVAGVGPGEITADYFAVFADRIQQLLGADRQDPPFVGILANGPCGDVTSSYQAAPRPAYALAEKMRLVAEAVAQEVLRVHRTISYRDWVELKASAAELELQIRRPTPEMLEHSRRVLARPAGVSPVHVYEDAYARHVQAAESWPAALGIWLQAFRIGTLGVAALPFETFAEIGLEIKAKSPFKDTFSIELANGAYGYLPTPRQHELGGYETWLGSNHVEAESSNKIVAKVLELFAEVK